MAQEESSKFVPLIKAISFTLNQFKLYSVEHPIVKESLQKLSAELQKYFVEKNKLTIGTMRDLLVVEGAILGKKEPSAQDLAKQLARVGIEALHIDKGVSFEEFSSFVRLLGSRPKDLEAKGGFKKLFEEQKYQNIHLASGKFQLIAEGESVAQFEETPSSEKEDSTPSVQAPTEAQPKTKTSIADIIQKIRSDQGDQMGPSGMSLPPIEIDCEKVVFQLEKKPQEAAQEAVQEVKDPAQLEHVIRRVVRYLTEGIITFLVDQGKDLTRALERFAKEIEKAIHKSLGEDIAGQMKDKVRTIFEETIDQHRIEMAVKTFQKNREDPKPVQKIVQKLFHDEQVRDRLLPSLRKELIDSGFDEKAFNEMFEKIEEKEIKKKSKVSVDAEELAELRRKAEMFEKIGANAAVRIEKLEREKKVIQDEKERVDTVIRNLAEGLVVVDKSGKVVLMNPAAEKMLGVKQSEKMGKKVQEGLSQDHMVAMTQGSSLRDSESGVAKNVELVSQNDETKRVLQASTAVIENEDGQTVGMVSVLSDVTKQKEVEQLKSQFVSNVSHELRTPLVAIQKSLSLILTKEVGEINPDQEKFLSIAHRNIDRLSRLINDLLDVAKLEAGRMTLRPVDIPVKELVMHVLSTMETWLKDKNIHVQTHFTNEGLEIAADPDRLTQVLTNLLGNAVKFTPDGGIITIEVNDHPASKISDTNPVEISVRDTGIGIAQEDLKKIFSKFVQVSLAQPAGVSSTGLGLTIVKEIVELHSGGVFVESEPGKGSRFYFQVPKQFKLREEAQSRF